MEHSSNKDSIWRDYIQAEGKSQALITRTPDILLLTTGLLTNQTNPDTMGQLYNKQE